MTQLGYEHVAQFRDPPWLYTGERMVSGSRWYEFWKVPSDNSLDAYFFIDSGFFGPPSFPWLFDVYPDG